MADLFKKAITNTPVRTKTYNGADTFESTTDPVVDLFFIIGASRGKNIVPQFEASLSYDEPRTLRMLFWARDIRGGVGERQTFRDLMKHLETNRPTTALKVISLIPEYGRWDDLLIFTSKKLQDAAFDVVKSGLSNKDTQGLCAKWMPRKGFIAKQLRDHLGWSPKRYRKALVKLSKNVVETKMCAKNWDAIDFSSVPSLAAARYQKAFNRNAPEKYQEYKDALTSKDPVVRATAKINASAVYPHDVLKSIFLGDPVVAKEQWEALPDYLGDSKILPVCDVSGSMGSWNYYYGGQPTKGVVRPIDVSISLGLYISDKQKGAFKDVICTFSTESRLEVLRGDIVSKAKQLQSAHWDMSTNIEAAFRNVLKLAVQNKVPQEDMPKMLLIISDMEFDQCTRGTAYETARTKYAQYGYDLPKIVFWNVNARSGNNPVTFKQDGTALVSGYSPSILKAILEGDFEKFTPQSIMDAAIMSARYNPVADALAA